MKSFTYIFLLFVSGLFLYACNDQPGPEYLEDGSYLHCFNKITENKDNPENKSMIELIVNVMPDGSARGDYNWIPYEKDKRLGVIEGKVVNGVFVGENTYLQEGSRIEEAVKIELNENSAIIIPLGEQLIVNGVPIKREYARNDTLGRVYCE